MAELVAIIKDEPTGDCAHYINNLLPDGYSDDDLFQVVKFALPVLGMYNTSKGVGAGAPRPGGFFFFFFETRQSFEKIFEIFFSFVIERSSSR